MEWDVKRGTAIPVEIIWDMGIGTPMELKKTNKKAGTCGKAESQTLDSNRNKE